MKLLKKGAEADLFQTKWQNSEAILKIRKPKKYRNSLLDSKIRKQRTIKESQILSQVKLFGIHAPIVYFVSTDNSAILMQKIPGKIIHDLPDAKIIEISREIGKIVGTLHKNGIMHGDLTTSNFILFQNTIFVLDFGLSQNTIKPQDHAVDLRLIKEILNSAHAKIMEQSWKNFLSGYRSVIGPTKYPKILKLVSEIEGRGRYAKVV